MAREPKPTCYFGEVLVSIARNHKISLREWAEDIVRQPVISFYVRCERLPGVDTVVKLAEKLNLPRSERRRLYRARMIGSHKNPIWKPEIVDALPKARLLTPKDIERMFTRKGHSISRLAVMVDANEQVIHKIVRLEKVEILGKRRSAVAKYLEKIAEKIGLSNEEVASVLLSLMKANDFPDDFVKTLTQGK